MANILLVEPNFRSKFPPLGLMRISAYHKERGDVVTFVKGKLPAYKDVSWNKIYVSSLFTYELPRTVDTIRYYSKSIESADDLIVGGIGATLLPSYIKERIKCRVIEGPLDKKGKLADGSPIISKYTPDYDLIRNSDYTYLPEDSYFCRVTIGCIRHCNFCAVPKLEPKFGYLQNLSTQIRSVDKEYEEKQHLVLLDNNILASEKLESIIHQIADLGFHSGAKRKGRKRTVDFNQGIDARLITGKKAKLLSSINLSPVRLAFDNIAVEKKFTKAVRALANEGFRHFTNYVMFNYNDDPASFYHRLRVSIDLSDGLDIGITSFPMRFVPITDVERHYISDGWRWRWIRGIQCILNATHGIVSPNPKFFDAAFGHDYNEFMNIISMPDNYIINRNKYIDNEAKEWRKQFSKLDGVELDRFLDLLKVLNNSKNRSGIIARHPEYRKLLNHYYPEDCDESQTTLVDYQDTSPDNAVTNGIL